MRRTEGIEPSGEVKSRKLSGSWVDHRRRTTAGAVVAALGVLVVAIAVVAWDEQPMTVDTVDSDTTLEPPTTTAPVAVEQMPRFRAVPDATGCARTPPIRTR